jgi:hypothetical protein
MTYSLRDELLALVMAARDDVHTCRVELGTAPLQMVRNHREDAAPAPTAPINTPQAGPVLRVAVARRGGVARP